MSFPKYETYHRLGVNYDVYGKHAWASARWQIGLLLPPGTRN